MIPKTQFDLFIVINKYGSVMRICQTFGEAYSAISEMVDGGRLIETKDVYDNTLYASEKNINSVYRIETGLFTYNANKPLVNIAYERYKMRKELFSELV